MLASFFFFLLPNRILALNELEWSTAEEGLEVNYYPSTIWMPTVGLP